MATYLSSTETTASNSVTCWSMTSICLTYSSKLPLLDLSCSTKTLNPEATSPKPLYSSATLRFIFSRRSMWLVDPCSSDLIMVETLVKRSLRDSASSSFAAIGTPNCFRPTNSALLVQIGLGFSALICCVGIRYTFTVSLPRQQNMIQWLQFYLGYHSYLNHFRGSNNKICDIFQC